MSNLILFQNAKSIFFILLSCFLVSCGSNSMQQYNGFTQGTYYSIKCFDKEKRNLQPSIDSLLTDFDRTASIFNPNSIISRVNNNDSTVVLNEDFIYLFHISMDVSKETQGAFDITVGQLVNAWGFGTKKRNELTTKEIDSLRQYVGYEKVCLENRIVKKENPAIRLDFNAIAKGYSVDKMGDFLESLGIGNYIVDIGGEVLAKGNKNGKKWVVAVERPAMEKTDQQQALITIPLNNNSLATSGNYRNYYKKDGIKYSHTICPQTGYPVSHNLLSVTVKHSKTAIADAYATAFMVMGLEKSLAFLKNHPEMEAYFIYDENGEMKMLGIGEWGNSHSIRNESLGKKQPPPVNLHSVGMQPVINQLNN